MNTNLELLSCLLKSAQLGQVGIRSVLDLGMQSSLRRALEHQLREYDTITAEAHSLASQRGWELRELDPALGFVTDLGIRLRLTRHGCDSRIADMLIRRNTRSMIRGLKELHRCSRRDDPVGLLTQRLLDCETAGIHRLQHFL